MVDNKTLLGLHIFPGTDFEYSSHHSSYENNLFRGKLSNIELQDIRHLYITIAASYNTTEMRKLISTQTYNKRWEPHQ